MRRPTQPAAFAAAFAGVILLTAGCSRTDSADAAKKAALTSVAAPEIDYAKVRPNEVGYIPVIMYHEIGGKPVRSDPALVRTVEAFKKDLELMYAAGFRPVNLSDVLNNTIDVPAGTSPIVLTFDDARESQFRLIETADALKIDPNSAMGVMDAFHKKHPDWRMRATFFVLPKSELTMEPFGQTGMGNQKLSYLIEHGMEIGNHTIHHRSMRAMTPAQIQSEIGGAHNRILEAVPGAKIQAVALPMGQYPRSKENWKYLLKGSEGGRPYEYKAAIKAAYRAVPSPASKEYDPLQLERIASRDDRWGVRWWIQEMAKGGGMYPRYVSDGDPGRISVPKGSENLVDAAKLKAENKVVHVYAPFGGGGGSKPIVGADADGAAPSQSPAAGAAAEKPITGG